METADNLGITATHIRRIKSGAEYDKYFPKATGATDIINENASVHDTLDFVKVLVLKTLNDTKQIAQILKRPTLEATCKSVFNFFYQHYQYKLDDYGVEQVRRPARAWADRKTGIDCDCFSASVSSVLTNLGIEHNLKIIAINGKEHYQHIYVVVPKTQGININSRANYWVIDPVLNSFDEEAPKITKTKHLKMEGIQLQQLNGVNDEVAGLGNEFEGVEELNGLNEEAVGRVFHRRLHAHVRKTMHHCECNPKRYAQMYNQPKLLSQLRKLDGALSLGNEAHLDGVLEELSNTEHEAVLPHLQGVYDAIHGHDDYLYGQMYGALDDHMIDTVSGLGRKGRSAKKMKSAKKGKRGFFTKIKNARKLFKSGKWKGKFKGAFKKVGRFLKKTNPLFVAVRGGFLMAMRTNFLKMGEKVYWGFQTKEYAIAKGIKPDYYDACLKVKTRLVNTYVNKLGGNESAIKKAVMNGRAAKKIAKLLKAKGVSGTSEALFGLGGLGSAVAAAGSITAAMAVLAPIIKMVKGLFKGKKSGLEKNENGTESAPSSDNPSDTSEQSNPSNSTITNDGSIENADKANNEEPSNDDGEKKKQNSGVSNGSDGSEGDGSDSEGATAKTANKTKTPGAETDQVVLDENGNPAPVKSNSTALIVGGVGLLALVGLAFAGKKKSTPKDELNGLGNFSKKRESKALKAKLTKQGIKMPHGYQVEKRKHKTVKTIKI